MIFDRSVILKGVRLVDGSGGPSRICDIALEKGRIRDIAAIVPSYEGAVEISLDGCCVSPGWIDLHTHVFDQYGIFSVPPSDIGLRTGVTTLVDAGSAGALNFSDFANRVISTARETVLAYVNIASPGISHGHAGRPGFVGDHIHPSLHDIDLAETVLSRHANSVIGWKARLSSVLANDDSELEAHAFQRLLALRDRTRLPIMVHHIKSTISPADVLQNLQERDVYTHLYHGIESSIFDPQTGAPLPQAWAARERGALFDVGHGSGAFRWKTAELACKQYDFWPDTISSDLHQYNALWPVRDLATTMSKFFCLGASLEKIVAMVTGNVTAATGRETAVMTDASIGKKAELTVFVVENGQYEFPDAAGEVRVGDRRITPLATIKDGEIHTCYGFHCRSDAADALAAGLQEVTGR